MKIRCRSCGQMYEKGTDLKHKAILQYIIDNPMQTQNQIMDAMTELHISSKMTTIEKLNELVEMGKIKDAKKGNSFHRYYVDQKKK